MDYYLMKIKRASIQKGSKEDIENGSDYLNTRTIMIFPEFDNMDVIDKIREKFELHICFNGKEDFC